MPLQTDYLITLLGNIIAKMTRRINWANITELPTETNPLFTTWNAFKKEILSNPNQERLVKTTCLNCKGSKPWSQTTSLQTASQTKNLWYHLQHKHPIVYSAIK